MSIRELFGAVLRTFKAGVNSKSLVSENKALREQIREQANEIQNLNIDLQYEVNKRVHLKLKMEDLLNAEWRLAWDNEGGISLIRRAENDCSFYTWAKLNLERKDD